MHRKLLITFILILSSVLRLGAQSNQVTGTIVDSFNNRLLGNAVVMVVNPKDSSLVKFTRTKSDGTFEINGIRLDSIKVHITFPGYADFTENFKFNGNYHKMGMINFIQLSQLIDAVLIRAQGGKMKFKGDTLVYLADSFKTKTNATVEDLLKKLPGLQVNRNGEITAQGKKVERVLVDGEEFFGDDPTVATKNLDAKSVKEVTVYDAQSEEAKRTGDNNAEKVKTLDIKLKDEAKTGYFGKVTVANSLDFLSDNPQSFKNLYEQRLLFSSFKDKRKFSVFGLRGNTANVGMSWNERNQFGERNNEWFSDGMYYSSNTSSDDQLDYNGNSGVPKSLDIGTLYSNQWKKHKLNLNASYRELDVYNLSTSKKIQLLENKELWNYSENSDTNKRYQYRATAKWEFQIDSMNSIIMNLKGTLSGSNHFSLIQNNSRLNIDTLNKQFRDALDTGLSYSTNIDLKYNHKFKKSGRSFNITSAYSRNKSEGNNAVLSNNYLKNGLGFNEFNFDQYRLNNSNSENFSGTLNFIEPLNKTVELLAGVEYYNTKQYNILNVYNRESVVSKIDSLGNNYMLGQSKINGSLGLQYKKKKFSVYVGVKPQVSTILQSENLKNLNLDKTYQALLPSVTVNWGFSKMGFLNLTYVDEVSLPSAFQLQPIINNSNPLYINQGNISLGQSLSHKLSFMFRNGNMLNQTWYYFSGSYTMYESNFITSTLIDTLGRTISKTEMGKNNANAYIYGNISKGIKGTPIELSTGINYYWGNSQVLQNGILGQTTNSGFSVDPSIYLDLNVVSFDIGYDFNLNNNTSDFYKGFSNQNWTQSLSVGFDLGPVNKTTFSAKQEKDENNGWSLSVDYEANFRQQTSIYNVPNNKLINGSLSYTHKKKKEYVFSLRVNDLLNENINYSRNVIGNQIFENTNTIFKRYVLLEFVYKFKNKPKVVETNDGNDNLINK